MELIPDVPVPVIRQGDEQSSEISLRQDRHLQRMALPVDVPVLHQHTLQFSEETTDLKRAKAVLDEIERLIPSSSGAERDRYPSSLPEARRIINE